MRNYSVTCEISQQECVGRTRYQEVQKCVEVKISENNFVPQWDVGQSANPSELDMRLCRSSL